MIYSVKKVNNCFKDAETYEYVIEVKSGALLDVFEQIGALKVNTRLRRPVFTLDMQDNTNVKGILAEPVLRVSFRAPGSKTKFESWLGSLEVNI